MKRSFAVKAIWDEKDEIWVSESDIRGLHLEAKTLEEFYELVNEFAPELIATNHYSEDEMAGRSLRDVIPAVVISHIGSNGRAA